tara:strand:+ start:691 stop:1137 length:447 start_codon:yes stop_codon:yes gene_type:complete
MLHKKKPSKVIYTAAFLDLSGKEGDRIKDLIFTMFNKDLPKKYFHHLTFVFKPTKKDISVTPFGKKVTLYVDGIAEDDRAQALRVYYSDQNIKSQNKIPHITVATDGTTQPKYSNELLKLHTLPLSEAIAIPATIGWWNGKEPVYTAP